MFFQQFTALFESQIEPTQWSLVTFQVNTDIQLSYSTCSLIRSPSGSYVEVCW